MCRISYSFFCVIITLHIELNKHRLLLGITETYNNLHIHHTFVDR